MKAERDSCAARDASSAPEAIWSLARFSSSAALDASAIPEASWLVAVAIRSAACCCLASVLAFLRYASASRAVTADDFPTIVTEAARTAAFLASAMVLFFRVDRYRVGGLNLSLTERRKR